MQYYIQLNLQKRDIFYKPYVFAYQYTDISIKITTTDDNVYIIPTDIYLMISDHDGFISAFDMEQLSKYYRDIKLVVVDDVFELKAKRIKSIEKYENVITHAPFDKMTMIGIYSQDKKTAVLISNDIPRRLPKDCHFADYI